MHQQDHARLLLAYTNALAISELEDIVNAQKASWYASMNLGTSAQLAAQRTLAEVVQEAVNRILLQDRLYIETVVAEVVAPNSQLNDKEQVNAE